MTTSCIQPEIAQTRNEKLGVLFVHGVGDQKKGETIIGFGDPLITWLERWLQRDGRKLIIERVNVDDDTPTDVLISTPTSTDKILFKECWWASKFKPPSVFNLGWWMLLVGTCATFLHAAKQFRQSKWWSTDTLNAIFRSLFFYIPIAIFFQVMVCTLTLLGSVPFTPWRDLCASLLLKLSRTLGDSFVFISSPVQRRMAFDTVLSDLDELLGKCEHVVVVAHSQGAAIAYKSLLPKNLFRQDCKSRITLVSVGSGLEKLDELERLNAVLEFRHNPPSSQLQKHILYLSPLFFLGCWCSAAALLVYGLSLQTALWAMGALVATTVALSRLLTLKRTNYTYDVSAWYDIHATSDPVSNGNTTGPTQSIMITNEKSLLRDHTTYFTNNNDFIPRLIKIMHERSGISWIDNIDHRSILDTTRGSFNFRSTRKLLLVTGKWLSGLGFAVYVMASGDSLKQQLRDTSDLLFALTRWFSEPSVFARVEASAFHFVFGLFAMGCLYFFLIWCDVTAERSDTNLLFVEDKLLVTVVVLLTVVPIITPLVVWTLLLLR